MPFSPCTSLCNQLDTGLISLIRKQVAQEDVGGLLRDGHLLSSADRGQRSLEHLLMVHL